MKNFYLIILFLFCVIFANAQTDTTQTKNDSSSTQDAGINAIDPGGDCISLNPTSLSFDDDGGTQNVGVTATCQWSASDNKSWISIYEDHSAGIIEVTCSANPNYSSRTGTVTVSSSTESHSVSIYQSAKECAPITYTLNGTSTSWCQGSGSSTTLTLSGSESGVDYTLQDGSTNIETKSGTGSSISWTVSPNVVGDHTYSVLAERISPSCEKTMDGTVTITVNKRPTAYSLSKSGNICDGYNIILSNSEDNMTYKLKRDGSVIHTTFISDGNGGNSIDFGFYTEYGDYSVLAVDEINGCTNTMANTVTISAPSTPSITSPSDKTICENNSVTFTVDGTNVNSFQWQAKSPGGNYTNIGTDSESLSLTGVSLAKDGYQYRCIGEGTCESAISGSATLTVNPNTQITDEPSNLTVCEATDATFNVNAQGTNLSYQWQSDVSGSWQDLSDGGDISGAATKTLTIANSTPADNADYRCQVSGDCGSDQTSSTVSLTVNPITQITSQPADLTVCEATDATFNVNAQGTNLSYQ